MAYAQATLPAAGPLLNGTFNAIDTTPFAQNQMEYTFRVDQTIGQSDFLWFRYSAAAQDNVQSGGRPALQFLSERPGLNYGTSWMHTFSPTTVLQVQFGHSNVQDNSSTRFVVAVPDIGWNPNFAGNYIGGGSLVPGVGVDGFFGGGESDSLNTKFGGIFTSGEP